MSEKHGNKKNVLLLCLSPLATRPKKNSYSYGNKDGAALTGFMTNEAPTKAVIETLKRKNERLDKIVIICSEKTSEVIKLDEEWAQENADELNGIIANQNATHKELYKRLINEYAVKTDARYQAMPVEYAEINIPNQTEDYEVSGTVIDAATAVGNDVNLYIDFNGGQRYIAFMIVAISNLMKNRSVEISRILTMNFDDKAGGITPIQNMNAVFNSFDLVSGINEYTNYGRIKTLKEYFDKNLKITERVNKELAKKIEKILKDMKTLSENLQLCRTGYIMENREALWKELNEYSERMNAQTDTEKSRNAYEQLFGYVIQDIIKGYRDLLTGEMPAVIGWCIERDFVQQALTFITEEMPGYFNAKKIFYGTPGEQQEFRMFVANAKNFYETFESRMSAASKNEKTSLKGHKKQLMNMCRENCREGSAQYFYSWMVQYLPWSSSNKDAISYIINDPRNQPRLAFASPQDERSAQRVIENEAKRCASSILTSLQTRVSGVGNSNRLTSRQMEDIRRDAESVAGQVTKLLYYKRRSMDRRAASCLNDMNDGKLKKILCWYFLLKGQRNQTNHAADESNNGGEMWSYDKLIMAIQEFIETLK